MRPMAQRFDDALRASVGGGGGGSTHEADIKVFFAALWTDDADAVCSLLARGNLDPTDVLACGPAMAFQTEMPGTTFADQLGYRIEGTGNGRLPVPLARSVPPTLLGQAVGTGAVSVARALVERGAPPWPTKEALLDVALALLPAAFVMSDAFVTTICTTDVSDGQSHTGGNVRENSVEDDTNDGDIFGTRSDAPGGMGPRALDGVALVRLLLHSLETPSPECATCAVHGDDGWDMNPLTVFRNALAVEYDARHTRAQNHIEALLPLLLDHYAPDRLATPVAMATVDTQVAQRLFGREHALAHYTTHLCEGKKCGGQRSLVTAADKNGGDGSDYDCWRLAYAQRTERQAAIDASSLARDRIEQLASASRCPQRRRRAGGSWCLGSLPKDIDPDEAYCFAPQGGSHGAGALSDRLAPPLVIVAGTTGTVAHQESAHPIPDGARETAIGLARLLQHVVEAYDSADRDPAPSSISPSPISRQYSLDGYTDGMRRTRCAPTHRKTKRWNETKGRDGIEPKSCETDICTDTIGWLSSLVCVVSKDRLEQVRRIMHLGGDLFPQASRPLTHPIDTRCLASAGNPLVLAQWVPLPHGANREPAAPVVLVDACAELAGAPYSTILAIAVAAGAIDTVRYLVTLEASPAWPSVEALLVPLLARVLASEIRTVSIENRGGLGPVGPSLRSAFAPSSRRPRNRLCPIARLVGRKATPIRDKDGDGSRTSEADITYAQSTDPERMASDPLVVGRPYLVDDILCILLARFKRPLTARLGPWDLNPLAVARAHGLHAVEKAGRVRANSATERAIHERLVGTLCILLDGGYDPREPTAGSPLVRVPFTPSASVAPTEWDAAQWSRDQTKSGTLAHRLACSIVDVYRVYMSHSDSPCSSRRMPTPTDEKETGRCDTARHLFFGNTDSKSHAAKATSPHDTPATQCRRFRKSSVVLRATVQTDASDLLRQPRCDAKPL